MTLLDHCLPVYEFREQHSARVRAAPARAFQAIKAVRPAELPIMRVLLMVRALPQIFSRRRRPIFRGERSLVDAALQAGFILLGEVPDRELVVGTIGQPWKLRGGASPVIADAVEYQRFDRPGYVKIATNFLIRDDGAGIVMCTETRIHATDVASGRAFRRYWRVIYPGSALIRREWLSAIRRRAEMR